MALSLLAIVMTIVALLPTLRAETIARNLAVLQLWMASMRFAHPPQVAQEKPDFSSGYIGVVLWPPPKRKPKIVAPLPVLALGTPATRRSMVIPFDGPYLYSKVAGELPGPLSHIAHGTPLSLKVASSDQNPIFMQAHQQLDSTLDPQSCSAVEIAFDNRESAGPLQVGLVLTDTGAPSAPAEYLGLRTLQPGQQSVAFPLPDSKRPRPFNDLRVMVIEPIGTRAKAGARVAIDHFTLISR